MECWHSRAKTSKTYRTGLDEAEEYIQKMRASTPIVWWKSICYHYLRKTKHVTRYRNGEPVTGTQVYYERVNSHTSGNIFMFDSCGVKVSDLLFFGFYAIILGHFERHNQHEQIPCDTNKIHKGLCLCLRSSCQ